MRYFLLVFVRALFAVMAATVLYPDLPGWRQFVGAMLVIFAVEVTRLVWEEERFR